MKVIYFFITIVVTFSSHVSGDNYKQRHSPTTDFLAHEGAGSALLKRDYVAPTIKDYNEQFPSLGSRYAHPSPQQTTIKPEVIPPGKRDYVAPQNPTQKPQNSGRRDNVAQSPTPNLHQSTRDEVASLTPTRGPQNSGKRDYVASQVPQHVTPKPTNGKAKDLISFFDSKPTPQSQKVPSYSNILQGNKNSDLPTQHVTPAITKATLPPPTKPLSFSSVVGGNSKQSSTSFTQKPPSSSVIKPLGPGSTVLPSSLVNINKNVARGNNTGPSDAEIQTLSEELLRKDTNNAAKYITINYQGKTTSQSSADKAQEPLLTITSEAWNIPTVQKLLPLLDNYERDTTVNEYVTPQERNEENAFMDAIMSTTVIRHLMNFLKERGYVSPDPQLQRDFLKQMWFNLYSRGKGKISSSGFEHVFVSELKDGTVQGLHNWIYFSREEAANRVNYLGYLKYVQLGDKGAVLKFHITQQGIDKPVNSIFIGTSPELEIALYTLCFVTRIDNDCTLKLATKDVSIVAYNFRYRSKNYIGSAFPQI